jgi:hypothetical protein
LAGGARETTVASVSKKQARDFVENIAASVAACDPLARATAMNQRTEKKQKRLRSRKPSVKNEDLTATTQDSSAAQARS